MASSSQPYDFTTKYTVNGSISTTLDQRDNSDQLAKIQDVLPDGNGSITIEVAPNGSSVWGVINA